jgi:hypothetical protein
MGQDRLVAYLSTWWDSRRFRMQAGRNAIDEIRDDLAA